MTQMKAWVLKDIGKIEYSDVPKPVPGPGEVLVKVCATGICGSDVPRVYKTGAHNMPLVIGHEFAGIVEKVGAEQAEAGESGTLVRDGETGLSSADADMRVGVFPLIPCRQCGSCREGRYEMCRHYDYLGSRRDGGFAEYVAVPEANLIRLPDEVTYEEAAMMEPMAVAVHAIRRVLPLAGGSSRRFAPQDDMRTSGTGTVDLIGTEGRMDSAASREDKDVAVCIIGLGTIGQMLSDFLMDAGYRNIYAVGRKPLQKQLFAKLAEVHGILDPKAAVDGESAGKTADCPGNERKSTKCVNEHYCDSSAEDPVSWIMEKTDGAGADIVFECVGSCECINMAVEAAAPAGKVVMVGNPASDITFSRDTYWKILRNQLTVCGTWNSSFDLGRRTDAGLREKRSFCKDGRTKDDAADMGIGMWDYDIDDWKYVLDRLKSRAVHPESLISHRFALSDLESGLVIMRDKTEDYCKIITVV